MPNGLDFSYSPAYEDYWRTYEVESLILDTKIGIRDTTRFELKEVFESSYIDTTGDLVYRVERYRKSENEVDWKLFDIIREVKTEFTFDRIVDNQRQVNVVYPLIRFNSWNGNMYLNIEEESNYLEDWNYKISYFDREGSVNDILFDSTLYIEQIEISDVHILRSANEIYAKGVGLVFKRIMYFDSQSTDENLTWDEKAEKGFSVSYMIKDYKK